MRKRKFAFIAPSSSSSVGGSVPQSARMERLKVLSLPLMFDIGDSTCVCHFCGAVFWFAERNIAASTANRPVYTQCCRSGTVILPYPFPPPPEIRSLYLNNRFMADIRAYNSMFAMTSFGADVDEAVNDGRGPYVFKISGQIYHSIGSLCPEDNNGPRFLQLYTYDTDNEVSNRVNVFPPVKRKDLDIDTIKVLIGCLTTHNEYIRTFKTSKQIADEKGLHSYSVCLYSELPDRRYSVPTPGTLGCIVIGDENNCGRYDIVIQSKGGNAQRVSKLHPSYMPLQYPLLFPYGEDGWSPRLKIQNKTGASAKKLTVNMYYSYQIHPRQHIYSHILQSGRLFQQYLVDAYTCVEADRLDYILHHQEQLRSDYVSGLYDAISKGDRDSKVVGKRVYLPASFVGGPRYMYKHYQDALAICRVYGNPQFFITFTCNVKWPEIERFMDLHQQHDVHSRADIISRVFQIKINAFIKFMKEDKTFGDVIGYLYTIEFQKRGLPHCHTLLWTSSADRIKEPGDIDKYISAELPDPVLEAGLYDIITSCMIHGPCGLLNKSAPCMKNNNCSKKYPKPFQQSTFFDKNGYACYKRNSSSRHTMRNGIVIDNGYVVPYNKRLSSRFRAHINVEYCGWNMMVKYLFKYISKGVERIRFTVQKNESSAETNPTGDIRPINEVNAFLDGRFVCPHEAAWRILNFDIHIRRPPVMTLPVHLPHMQNVIFRADMPLDRVLSNPSLGRTPLLGWFDSNARDPTGHDLTYMDYPKEYKWDSDSNEWSRRVYESSIAIGRLLFVHPSSGELFYLRMLLCHQKGCTSYEDIRTVSGVLHATFRDACSVLGLIGDDIEWMAAFNEASAWATSAQLRSLFCHLLLFCEVSNPLSLWEAAHDKMVDDYLHKVRVDFPNSILDVHSDIIQQQLLMDLESMLQSSTPSRSLADFKLSTPLDSSTNVLTNRLLLEESMYDREDLHRQHLQMASHLNKQQMAVYQAVLTSNEMKKQCLLFVYGHGGTGKTFLWTVIISYFRSVGKVVLAVAASGIASLLLPCGRTAHSRFKIPIDLSEKKSCDIKKKTSLAELLQHTSLIIWDEAPMSDRRCFECLDRSLRDILDCDHKPFGGLSVLLGGDFRQTLPVKSKSTREAIISSTLPHCYLWKCFKVYRLTDNMRLKNTDATPGSQLSTTEFAEWILRVGNGTVGEPDKEDPTNSFWVNIPDHLLIPPSNNSLQLLIDFVYGDGVLHSASVVDLSDRAIVCPTNEAADKINDHIVQMAGNIHKIYRSTDTMQPNGKYTSELEGLYPVEFLNQLHFPNIPAHLLTLKPNIPIILMRNISQKDGLCNGTRLIVSQLLPSVIEATVITGTCIGKRVYIPRIKFIHNPPDLPFSFARKQFPIKVCYAMTINKSQGQSLKKIGVYLPQHAFTHGQLYVALSRATSPDSIKVLINNDDNNVHNVTKNVVFRDLLSKI